MSDKTRILYDQWNPNAQGVDAIAIQTESENPYVWKTYGSKEEIPKLPSDLLVINAKAARRMFDFVDKKDLESISKE